MRADGVRTVADLMGRCRVDSITGCWLWGHAASESQQRPSLWLPALKRRVSLGVAICWLRTGKAPAKGVVWHCTCETTDCANPDHRRAGNRSSQMLAAKLTRSPVAVAKMAAGRRAKSKLSDAGAAEIRASTEPLRVLADRHGISISHASMIRRCVLRRPVAAKASSVFSLGMSR